MVDHAEVFGTHDGCPVVLLENGIVASGTLLFLKRKSVVPAACVAAVSVVAASSCKMRGKEAASAVGHAHCTVDEGFEQKIRVCVLDASDIRQRSFAAEYDFVDPFQQGLRHRYRQSSQGIVTPWRDARVKDYQMSSGFSGLS